MSLADKLIEIERNVPKVYEAGEQAEYDRLSPLFITRTATTFSDSKITELGSYALSNYSTLTAVDLPSLTKAGDYLFRNCSALSTVNLPLLSTIRPHVFYGCAALKRVSLPAAGWVSTGTFQTCTSLEFIDLGTATNIGAVCFSGDTALKTIVIRNTAEVLTLAGTNAFTNTPYANGGSGGKIYVPSALIEQYKTATNWSVLYGYGTVEFVALEGSEYENADY